MNYVDRSLKSVSSRIIPVQPFDYVVFGATGDLTKRKLIPALYHRFLDGQFDEQSRIIGVSRSKLSDDDFRKLARESIEAFVEKNYQDKKAIDRFLGVCSYIANDVTDEAKWGDLSKNLRDDPEVVRAFYLAIAPDLFGPTCEYISRKGYYRRDARVVIEKPLGHDLESSKQINDEVSRIFADYESLRRSGVTLQNGELKGMLKLVIADPSVTLKSLMDSGRQRSAGVKRMVQPRSPNQRRYVEAIEQSDMTFGLGPAGTGKTYLAVAMAVSALISKKVSRIQRL